MSVGPGTRRRRERLQGEAVIPEGCTEGHAELSRTASGVYILALLAEANPENRWVPALAAAVMRALEAVEAHLEAEAGDSPAALLTVSESPKYFSNGIDPDGRYSRANNLPALSAEEAAENGMIFMPSFFRPLQLPIPTVAAINGHAFGAGMMFAVAHDYRLQRKDRGFMCAVEIEIGVGFPTPEKFLFRHVLSKPNFQRTVLGAKRWDAASSLQADLIEEACSEHELFPRALAFAEQQARLARGPHGRRLFMTVKNQVKGHVMRSCVNFAFPGDAFPEQLAAKFPSVVASLKAKYPNFLRHIGEPQEELPNGEFMPGAGRFRSQDTYNELYDNATGGRKLSKL